ncbi:MAG TPA: hypothetical protein VFU31_24730 [Candidatus Binatia bacterium]|nr:hypothetical protein [Candidatus Binatia bacterium]
MKASWTDQLLAEIKRLPKVAQIRLLATHARQIESAHRKQTKEIERFHRAIAR